MKTNGAFYTDLQFKFFKMDNDYYQDYDEEEEWDREQLLDPAWEKQQKKVCPPE